MTNKNAAGKAPAVSKSAVATPVVTAEGGALPGADAPAKGVADDVQAASAQAAAAESKRLADESAAGGALLAAESQDEIDKVFPCSATLRNNSPIPIVETYSGAYMGAGGSSDVTIHDVAHLQTVRQNLDALAAVNYFDPALLVIDGLPS